MELADLLRAVCAEGVSDIHFKAGRPPLVRRWGRLLEARGARLSPEHTAGIARAILGRRGLAALSRTATVSAGYAVSELGRFRATFYRQRGSIEAVLRFIPTQIGSAEELGLPAALSALATARAGLVVLAGAVGAGKSTTARWLLGEVIRRRAVHVLTLEDPVELVFADDAASVNQLEIGTHCASVEQALARIGRQDVDVLLVGPPLSTRRLDVLLRMAQAGTLIFAFVNAPSAVDALRWMFESSSTEHNEALRELASTGLEAVVAQRLLPAEGSAGQVAAMEVVRRTSALTDLLVRQANLEQVRDLQQEREPEEMLTLERHLIDLALAGRISATQALEAAQVPVQVERQLFLS